MKLDINCDLGEGEPLTQTRRLMRWVSSVNIACGGHAGDLLTMRNCIRLAKHHGIKLGAHPGPWSRKDFGRSAVEITPDEFQLLLLQQVGALVQVARAGGVRLHHIKLHGSLYHAAEADRVLARRYLNTVAQHWPRVKVFARAGGLVSRLAKKTRVSVWEEAFADRGYRDDGTLVPRDQPGALLTDLAEVRRRLEALRDRSGLTAISGSNLKLSPDTVCVHSDTPQAVEIAKLARHILTG